MKTIKTYILWVFMLFSLVLYTQNNEKNILISKRQWSQEALRIPFSFAPEIKYEGSEDIRFSNGWGKVESEEFWTYVFVWNMDLYQEPDIDFFQKNLKFYYDGLMNAVNKEKDKIIPETVVGLKEEETSNNHKFFYGTLYMYDAFRTKKMITLNIVVETKFCFKTKKYLPIFRCSPQPFEHPIWKELYTIGLKENVCN